VIGNEVESINFFDFISPKYDPEGGIGVSQKNIHCIAVDPKLAPGKFHLVTGIEAGHQTM
jgi:hypothetical protein